VNQLQPYKIDRRHKDHFEHDKISNDLLISFSHMSVLHVLRDYMLCSIYIDRRVGAYHKHEIEQRTHVIKEILHF
jgi:hypothetical protein